MSLDAHDLMVPYKELKTRTCREGQEVISLIILDLGDEQPQVHVAWTESMDLLVPAMTMIRHEMLHDQPVRAAAALSDVLMSVFGPEEYKQYVEGDHFRLGQSPTERFEHGDMSVREALVCEVVQGDGTYQGLLIPYTLDDEGRPMWGDERLTDERPEGAVTEALEVLVARESKLNDFLKAMFN